MIVIAVLCFIVGGIVGFVLRELVEILAGDKL